MEDQFAATDDVGTMLDQSAMADSASFGLEYVILGRRDKRVIELLTTGIKLCKSFLESAEKIPETLQTEDDYLTYLSLDAFLPPTKTEKALRDGLAPDRDRFRELLNGLEHVVHVVESGGELPAQEEIRELQRSLGYVSTSYLRGAVPRIRRLDEVYFE